MMINDLLINYIQSIQPKRNETYLELEKIGQMNKIPIIPPETGYFIQLLCMLKKPKRILEIGTAIGYSTMWFYDNSQAVIDTIEIDEKRKYEAEETFAKYDRYNRVNFLLGDALDVIPTLSNSYDIIFIDAAKGQYAKYFELIDKITSKDAMVITDNVFFHGMVAGISEPPKRLSSMVNKIVDYNQMLANDENWLTTFYSIGDGVAISIKK